MSYYIVRTETGAAYRVLASDIFQAMNRAPCLPAQVISVITDPDQTAPEANFYYGGPG